MSRAVSRVDALVEMVKASDNQQIKKQVELGTYYAKVYRQIMNKTRIVHTLVWTEKVNSFFL